MAETQPSCGFSCGNFTIGKSRLHLGSVMLNYDKKEIKLSPSQVLTQEHVQLPPSFYCKTSGQSHISPVHLCHAFCFPYLVSPPSSHTQRMKHLWELNPGKGSCKSKHPTMSYCFTRDRVNGFKWHRNRLGASVSMTPKFRLVTGSTSKPWEKTAPSALSSWWKDFIFKTPLPVFGLSPLQNNKKKDVQYP